VNTIRPTTRFRRISRASGIWLSQHGLPGRETLPDLQLQAADLRPADSRGHVQLEQEPLVPFALGLPFLERRQQGRQVRHRSQWRS